MRILISNDDGYEHQGIKQLAKSLSDIAEIIILAPNNNRSAASSSLTVGKPLKPIKVSDNIYKMEATPSDCVHLALCGFIKKPIDLVVTGINLGENLGDDVIYSGTIAGAIEGRFLHKPSIAISLAGWDGNHFDTAGILSRQIIEQIYKAPVSSKTILNINIPDLPLAEIKGIKSTILGSRHMSSPNIQDEKDPFVYFIGANGKEDNNSTGTDFHAINNNYVSVTPIHMDFTKHSEVQLTQDWLNQINY